MKNDILLSIICPAYNEENTIGRLIDSIISQKYDNYELILLNDGSKDKTFEIITEYARKYQNIIAINKPNTGVGDTRNIGLKIARGKYIAFADSDDWYSSDFFEKIVPQLEKSDFEMLVFNANVMNYDTHMYDLISEKYNTNVFETNNGLIEYLQGEFCHRIGNTPWNKIYLNEIIKNNSIEFNVDKKTGEDMLFNMLYVSKIKKYKYINDKLYNYALNMNTLTTKVYRKNVITENLKFYSPIKNMCVDNNIDDYEKYMAAFFIRRFFGIVLNETNNDNYKSGIKNIKDYLNNPDIKYIFSRNKKNIFDFKLYIGYIFYKFQIYKIYYLLVWFKRSRKKKF